MNPYIMLGLVIVLLIGAIVRSIDWKGRALRWVSYNPKHGQMYVKSGGHVKTYAGEQSKTSANFYYWREEDKELKFIGLPDDYPHLNIRGRRIIGVENGVSVASPLGFMTPEQRAKYKENSVNLSALVHSDIAVKVLRSISNTKPFNWTMVIIIGVVVIGGLWWYNGQNKKVPGNPVTANQTQLVDNTTSNLILITPPLRTVVP